MANLKPTITVAVSAYNEQANIKAFLESVLSQHEIGFKLKKIIVISDGSTDDTEKIVKSFRKTNIKLIAHRKRAGKSERLNEIYTALDSDILVQSDCDVVFSHPKVIHDLIQPILKDKRIGMCGGNPKPLEAQTYLEKAVNYTCEAYGKFRSEVRGGDNLFSADGRLLAFRTSFIRFVRVPADMIANDAFAYFCCLYKGYKYKYVQSATVWYRSPQTVADQIRQNTRFLAAPIRLSKYFPRDLVERETKIPMRTYLLVMIKEFAKDPMLCLYIFLINKYCAFRARLLEGSFDSKWSMATTTKELA
ncbi:MAG: hypothetical protein UT84_C0005G0006 [Candidatus Curtissbacteria bacterium GW2011_GWA1_40_16]|uniref:Glycosyltransferase 2-like domain-containing protein n=1 Tax=Candidatus Curtissbacteria bacterium GW2011_GWA1_40_16 TaxID=1618405 RepID=A0A0G0TUU4_9BACT|nr:MAG: hypothetical protein UT84_C0005G0006 [Candidatus Curtissbacteria bacterium GW2011_GWA1_40_16]